MLIFKRICFGLLTGYLLWKAFPLFSLFKESYTNTDPTKYYPMNTEMIIIIITILLVTIYSLWKALFPSPAPILAQDIAQIVVQGPKKNIYIFFFIILLILGISFNIVVPGVYDEISEKISKLFIKF